VYVTFDKIAKDTGIPITQLRKWAFENRKNNKLWRGEFTPLQELWRPLPEHGIFAVFYHQSERVNEAGYDPETTPPVVPQQDYQEFMKMWNNNPVPDISSSVRFGEVLKWMAFKVKKGLKVYPNCYALYFHPGGTFSIIDELSSLEWSGTEFGIMVDCGNTYRRYIKPEKKVLAPPPVEKPKVVEPEPEKVEKEVKVEKKIIKPPPVKEVEPKKKFQPQFRAWAYIGVGGNQVEPEFGVSYTWKYAGVDAEFLPVYWLGLIGKVNWIRSTDHFWGIDREVWRPMTGFAIHQRRWTFRSLIGKDYDGKEFLPKYILEENLEIYPFQRTTVSLIGVYNNKPGDDWDYLWAQSEAKYALSVVQNNVRKLWLGVQYGWMGLPYWEKKMKGVKKLPEYTSRLEGVIEIEFGQKRDLVLKLTGGYGSQSIGNCGSITAIFRLK